MNAAQYQKKGKIDLKVFMELKYEEENRSSHNLDKMLKCLVFKFTMVEREKFKSNARYCDEMKNT